MNLLLLWPSELHADRATIDGRRASHVLGLLAKRAGDMVRVGVVGEGTGAATILNIDPENERVDLQIGTMRPHPPPTTSLVIAVPRPKGLSRIVQLAASFGVRRIDFVGAHKVDPAYFSSPRLERDRLEADALLGLEQGGVVHMPELEVHRSLARFIAGLPLIKTEQRVVFDPRARDALIAPCLASLQAENARHTLAFGPDGGFVPEELKLLQSAGFHPVSLSRSILRTEVAIAAGLGQLELVRGMSVQPPESEGGSPGLSGDSRS